MDNTTVRDAQIARLQKLRAERDSAACEAALEALSECARTGEGNLLDLAIKAAKARASLGEISSALEKHFGRHKAPIKLITGVYAQSYGQDPLVEEVRKMTDDFAERTGRRPRILVAKMGQDGHDRGAKVVSSAYADLGFDVDVGPLFQTPEETAKMAIENDVHMIGMSSLAAGHQGASARPGGRTPEAGASGHHGLLRRRHSRPGLRLPQGTRSRSHLRPRYELSGSLQGNHGSPQRTIRRLTKTLFAEQIENQRPDHLIRPLFTQRGF